jgi:hypothetical protein
VDAEQVPGGEPPVDGGDDAILVDRLNLVLCSDMASMSQANIAYKNKGTAAAQPGQQPCDQPGDGQDEPPQDEPPPDEPADDDTPRDGKGGKPPAESLLRRRQEAIYRKRLAVALKLMPKVTQTEREMLDPEDLDYRLATEPGRSCGNCVMFHPSTARCDILPIGVGDEHVCDRWLAPDR